MTRNLVRSIELLTAIKDEASKRKILQILKLQCSDNSLAHELQEDGSYKRLTNGSNKTINNHKILEDHVNRISRAVKKDTASSATELANRLFIES